MIIQASFYNHRHITTIFGLFFFPQDSFKIFQILALSQIGWFASQIWNDNFPFRKSIWFPDILPVMFGFFKEFFKVLITFFKRIHKGYLKNEAMILFSGNVSGFRMFFRILRYDAFDIIMIFFFVDIFDLSFFLIVRILVKYQSLYLNQKFTLLTKMIFNNLFVKWYLYEYSLTVYNYRKANKWMK